MDNKLSEPSDNITDTLNSLRGRKQLAEAAEKRISALLAELEAKDKRIAELGQEPTIKHMRSVEESLICTTDRVSELEAKLATPVRLPDVLFIKVSGSAVPVMHAERVKERLRAAGVKIEGDE